MAGLSTRITDSNKKFNPHLHIRKHADEDFLCTQQYFHRKSSSYLSPIQQDATPTKMSPPPLPLQNHFLFSPRRPSTQNPQAEPLIKYQKETQSHKRHTKSKQKKQFQHHRSKKSKEKPSKRQSKTIHQTPPTRKYTYPNSHPNPTNTLPNPTQKPYTPKRKDVFPQTQVHFTPNAEEFAPKRFGVSSKTQGRLTTNASPFSTPKSPDNSPSYLQKRPKIPKN